MTTTELQEDAVKSFIENKRLIVEFSTGVGKSKVAIDAIKKIKPSRILLVVAETLHKENWEKEFKKWGASKLFKKAVVECYASLHKYRDTSWDMCVFDEAHHLSSDLRVDIMSSISAEYIICLSATFPRRTLLPKLESIYGKFKIKSVGIQKAIDNDMLPEPTIYTIPLYLSSNVSSEEFIEEWGKDELKIDVVADYKSRWVYKRNRAAYPNIRMVVKCTPYQKYLYLCEQYDYWKRISAIKKSVFAKNKQMRFGSERKDFLGSLKTPLVPKLLEKLDDKRFICFCTNIEQCETLGGEYSIHSKKKESDDIVEKFNNLETDKLFMVFKGIEGMNFNDIDAGVFIQLDGKPLRNVQKMGRVYRSKNPEMFIFYYKNTRDEEFLKTALDGIDKKYIKTLNYNEIGT